MSNFILILLIIVCVGLLVMLLVPSVEKLRLMLHNMGPLVKAIIALILVVIIAVLISVLASKRGEGSIFAEDKEAESTGSADYDEEAILNECFSEATEGNATGDLAVYIRVCGEKVTVGAKEFTDMEELKDFLGILARSASEYVLVDDYASARAFKDVKEVLSDVGITYSETAENY